MSKAVIISATIKTVSPISVKQHGRNHAPEAYVGNQKHSCAPATTWRGALRRHCREEVDRKNEANGKKWGLREFFWNTIGGIRVDKDDAANDFKTLSDGVPYTLVENVRARNPLISLFGTFDPCAISGRLQIGNAVSDKPLINADGKVVLDGQPSVRSNDLVRSPEIASILDDEALDEYMVMTEGARKAAAIRREIVELERARKTAQKAGDDVAPFNEKIKKLEAQRDAFIKENKGSSVSIQQIIDASPTIPAGSVLNQRIRMFGHTDVELGLLFAGFRNFADSCMIGGMRNTGCGEVAVEWNIKEAGGPVLATIQVSLDDGFVVTHGKDYVDSKIAAWDAFAASDELKTHYPTKEELLVVA